MYIPINIYLKVSINIEKCPAKNVSKARSEGGESVEDTYKKLTNNSVKGSQLPKTKK